MSNEEADSRVQLHDSMLDMLLSSPDPMQWLRDYGVNGKSPMPVESARTYFRARRYMLHAPVLEKCSDSGRITVVPLNPLPEGEVLSSYLEMPQLDVLVGDSHLLESLYHCSLLPLTRRPLGDHAPPTARGRTTPCSIFGMLNFDAHPVRAQPTLCIVNWLRARNLDGRLSNSRNQIKSWVN